MSEEKVNVSQKSNQRSDSSVFLNLLSGVVGAIISAFLIFQILEIPSEMNNLKQSVSKVEGRVETFVAMQGQLNTLERRVESVERDVQLSAGVSVEHESGWQSLDQPLGLKRGDQIFLEVGGTARKVVVRLLPKGASPDFPTGVIPTIFTVPEDRKLNIELKRDYPQVEQISVHGGENPWGKYDLGDGNGAATLRVFEHFKNR
jgi:hypothetical protein